MNGVEAGMITGERSFRPSRPARGGVDQGLVDADHALKGRDDAGEEDGEKDHEHLGRLADAIVTIASGITASGGIMRKNCTKGSIRPRAVGYIHQETDRNRERHAERESRQDAREAGDEIDEELTRADEFDRPRQNLRRAGQTDPAERDCGSPQGDPSADGDDVQQQLAATSPSPARRLRRRGFGALAHGAVAPWRPSRSRHAAAALRDRKQSAPRCSRTARVIYTNQGFCGDVRNRLKCCNNWIAAQRHKGNQESAGHRPARGAANDRGGKACCREIDD